MNKKGYQNDDIEIWGYLVILKCHLKFLFDVKNHEEKKIILKFKYINLNRLKICVSAGFEISLLLVLLGKVTKYILQYIKCTKLSVVLQSAFF